MRHWLRRAGLDLVPYDASHPLARRARLLTAYRIGLVLDVGANTGQYALELRRIGYRGRIVSFEPSNAAFHELARHAELDAGWTAIHAAVGERNGRAELHLAGNSQSSSLLEMLPQHLAAAPDSRYCGREEVDLLRLDTAFDAHWRNEAVYLKIDAQGSERRVLDGAGSLLETIDTIQVELSLVPLYKGETLWLDMYRLLTEKGYQLVSLEQGFSDPVSGQALQIDGIFHRFAPSESTVDVRTT